MQYGKTADDTAAEKQLECRKIVKEIISFGVSQQQIPIIIKMLALELEDIALMRNVVGAVNNDNNSASGTTGIITKGN